MTQLNPHALGRQPKRRTGSAQATSEQRDIDPIALTINAAVAHSGISRTVLYGLMSSGRVKAVKAGRTTLILADSLRNYVNNLPPVKFAGSIESD